jgi:Divergent InlB B-repeat domain
VLGLALGVLAVGGAALAGGDQAGTGVLTVYVGAPPPAKVSVTSVPGPPLDCEQQEEGCVYTLPEGPVTLEASPQGSFRRWSDPACGSTPTCVTTVEPCAFEPQSLCGPIVATFAPVKLVLHVTGPGTATARPVGSPTGVTCGPQIPPDTEPVVCEIPYPEITEVEIQAEPSVEGTPFAWGATAFCDPDPTNAALCHAEVNFDPAHVGIGFEPEFPPDIFDVNVTLRVVRGGAGVGRITGVRRDGAGGQIIDCGTDCSEALDYARRVVLTAHPDADSTFEEWTGVCSTDPTCTLSAGAVTRVRAVFGKKQAPPPPPPPPSPPQPPPPSPRAAFSARILGVSVVRTRAARVVVARMRLNQAAAGRAQVRRGRRALTTRAIGLRAGRSLVRLPLRARVRRGRALFAITLRSSTGRTRSLTARFTIPRRR